MVGAFHDALAAVCPRSKARNAFATACSDACRMVGAMADDRTSARLPCAHAVPGVVLALHRWREHHHQDGGRLWAITGVRIEEPDRGAPDYTIRGVSRSA